MLIKGDPGLIAELSQRLKASLSARAISKVMARLKVGSDPYLVTYFFYQSHTHKDIE
jgi:hypothetical protein